MNAVTTIVNDPIAAQNHVVSKHHVYAGAVPTRIAAHNRFEIQIVVVDPIAKEPHSVRTDVYALLAVVMNVEVAADTV
jgi:hypothetical protein